MKIFEQASQALSRSILFQLLLGTAVAMFFTLSNSQIEVFSWTTIGVLGLFIIVGTEINFRKSLDQRNLIVKILILTTLLSFFFIYFVALYFGCSSRQALIITTVLLTTGTGVTVQMLLRYDEVKTPSGQVLVFLSALEDLPPTALLFFILSQGPLGHVNADSISRALISFVLVVVLFAILRFFFRGKSMSKSSWFCAFLVFIASWDLSRSLAAFGISSIVVGIFCGALLLFFDSQVAGEIKVKLQDLLKWILPFYFFYVGLKMAPSSLGDLDSLMFLFALLIMAFLGKWVPTYFLANLEKKSRSKINPQILAWGMVPRGVPGLAFATLFYQTHEIDQRIFSLLVSLVALSTWIGLFGLKMQIQRKSGSV